MGWSLIAMILILAVIVVTDIVLALNGKPGDTYSEMIFDWAKVSVFPPLAMGAVIGHWFFDLGIDRPRGGVFMLGAAVGVFVLIDAISGSRLTETTHPAVWVHLGISLGCTLWSLS